METWMIAILVVGAIIMFSVWGLIALGNRELKKQVRDEQVRDMGADWESANDRDDKAVYDTNGRRIR